MTSEGFRIESVYNSPEFGLAHVYLLKAESDRAQYALNSIDSPVYYQGWVVLSEAEFADFFHDSPKAHGGLTEADKEALRNFAGKF